MYQNLTRVIGERLKTAVRTRRRICRYLKIGQFCGDFGDKKVPGPLTLFALLSTPPAIGRCSGGDMHVTLPSTGFSHTSRDAAASKRSIEIQAKF
jgi:hypothetical protein